MNINAYELDYKELNEEIRNSKSPNITINNCMGQRYIGSGLSGKNLTINGIPGNALGSYLNGGSITVNGNTQDAAGDTMNDGAIYIHGSCGDAAGYAMRGGKIYIEGNSGYRAGIHMKAYKDKKPVIIIGGTAGSFLGEYQAGGIIIVLGLNNNGMPPVGYFCGTGMHGGKIFLRCDSCPSDLPGQVVSQKATVNDMQEIYPLIDEFCCEFKKDSNEILNSNFFMLTPDTLNPYKQLYVQN